MENAIGIGDRMRRIIQSFRAGITECIAYGAQNGFPQSFVSCVGVGLITRLNTENGADSEPSIIQCIAFAAKVGIVAGAASGILGAMRHECRRRRREHSDHSNEGHLSWCKSCTLRFMANAAFGSIGGLLGICLGCGIGNIMKGVPLFDIPTICNRSFWSFTDDDGCCMHRNNKLLDMNVVILAVIINELSYLINVDWDPSYSRMKGIQTQTEQEITFKRGLFENITSPMEQVTRHELYGKMLREYLLENSSIPQLTLSHIPPDSGNIWSESPSLSLQRTMETSSVTSAYHKRNRIIDNLNEMAPKALAGSRIMVISHLPFDVHLTVHSNQKRINLVVIHKTRGIILAHLLAVQNDCVTSEIKQSLAHFKEANRILKILSRDQKNVTITKVLIVQNIKRLDAMDEDIKQDICYCLEVGGISEAKQSHRCIDETTATENTGEWFEQLVSNIQGPDVMTETAYNKIVLRLYGISSAVDVYRLPLSRLEIHAEFENCEISTVQLTPWQLQILSSPERLMFITGPPGTGKTLILILKGVQWLQEGHDVYVISTWYKSPASSFVIEYQMRKTFQMLSPLNSQVIRRHYDFKKKENMKRADEDLKSKVIEGQLYLIVDEPGPDIWEDAFEVFTKFTNGDFKQTLTKTKAIQYISQECDLLEDDVRDKYCQLFQSEEVNLEQFQRLYISINTKNVFKDFCQGLSKEIPLLHLWVSSTDPFVRAECLAVREVNKAMRAPIDVVGEVKNCILIKQNYVRDYSKQGPVFEEKSSITRLFHHKVKGHSSGLPEDCRECGKNIAETLQHECHVGELGKVKRTFQFRDVLVICEDVHEETQEPNAREASGLVVGLRECERFGNKVRVVERDADMVAIKDTALALSNMVTVSNYLHVHGLERNIVVVAGDQTWANEYSKMYDVSRAALHLILIDFKRE